MGADFVQWHGVSIGRLSSASMPLRKGKIPYDKTSTAGRLAFLPRILPPNRAMVEGRVTIGGTGLAGAVIRCSGTESRGLIPAMPGISLEYSQGRLELRASGVRSAFACGSDFREGERRKLTCD